MAVAYLQMGKYQVDRQRIREIGKSEELTFAAALMNLELQLRTWETLHRDSEGRIELPVDQLTSTGVNYRSIVESVVEWHERQQYV